MNYLWAPWRMPYLKKVDKVKCFFCAFPKRKKDRKNLILRRGEHCFSILNRYPYNTGHLMVAPYAHKGKMEDLDRDEILELHGLAADMKKLLDRVLRPHGYNLGINLGRVAGAGVPGHLHLHLVPRWDGDTNFMPVVGGTKVLPVSLEELYDALIPARPLKKPRRRRR